MPAPAKPVAAQLPDVVARVNGDAISRADLDEAVAETGGTSSKDLGRVMKAVMVKLAGRGADGRVVNELVRNKLGA